MAKYSNSDLFLSDDGDLILSAQKDLESTETDPLRSLVQGIRTRLNFRSGEWPGLAKNLGANLSDFSGKPNTKENGEIIKSRVMSELTKNGFISRNDLNVDVIPISSNHVLVKIIVKTSAGIYEYNTRFSFREDSNVMKKGKP